MTRGELMERFRSAITGRFPPNPSAEDVLLILAELERLGLAVVPVGEDALAAERRRCWDAINAMIVPGDLRGNGTDTTAERNGLILATNVIFGLGISAAKEEQG